MRDKMPLQGQLEAENRELRVKLEAAEEMLRAIRSDEVDALVIAQGGADRVRTLGGADEAYRTFVEVMCQGAITVATDGSILYCNPYFAQLLRAPVERMIGSSVFEFVAPEQEGGLRAVLWEGMSASCEGRPLELRRHDGSAISTIVTAAPLTVGGTSCVLMVLTDLTEREALISAEAANRAKDRFLAALSHELRTPLTPVVMVVAAMEIDARLPSDVREDLAMVRRNVELETRLIDDLLDLSRVISGKLRMRAEPISTKSLIQNVLNMVSSDVNQKSLNVRCQWLASRDCVDGDPARLQQLIWNVIKNAVKFSSQRGEIAVRLWNSDDTTLQLEIRDRGVGINPALLTRIFNAFEQAETSSARQPGGLGLGLTISKAIVEMHGGDIRADSDGPGKGTTITVTLPVSTAQIAAPPAPAVSSDTSAANRKFRVLLVEDHRETATILAKLLERSGHTVAVAHTVESALSRASAEPFDLIISDIGLPDGTGHDLMRQIRKTCGIPGVALTGYGMEDDLNRSREFGFAEHIVKPVNLTHLQSVMDRVVTQHALSSKQSLSSGVSTPPAD